METASQYGIEQYVQQAFAQPGTFLEIGCWDGELLSQTAFLERELGWHGFCVDPFPRNFCGRSCTVIPRAISGDGKPRHFIKVSIDRRHGGDVSYFSGFKETLDTYWKTIQAFCEYEELEIETISFEDICRQYALPEHVNFLSVDTEGSELEIFQGIDFSVHSFGMIVFEHNQDHVVKESIGSILAAAGYEPYAELLIDSVFVRSPS